MAERPILRLLESPADAPRKKGGRGGPRLPTGPGRSGQEARLGHKMQRIGEALSGGQPLVQLREDPSAMVPERTLAFEVGADIKDFVRRADEVGLEVLGAVELEEMDEFPEGFIPSGDNETITPTLYATIPTLEALQQLRTLWNTYCSGEEFEQGLTPWRNLFDLLIDVRVWGAQDRLPEGVQAEIEAMLPPDDDEEVQLEIEIWPTRGRDKRRKWREEVEAKVEGELGGRIIDRSGIGEKDLIYEALLVGLTAGAVRDLLADPEAPKSIAHLEGIQFILPQTIAQSPSSDVQEIGESNLEEPFNSDAPIRAALLDGTPVAAHPVLDGGIVIEDVHDLVRLSQVSDRAHATSMASLILRGDLLADGAPLVDSRIVSVPVLIDYENHEGLKGTKSPPDKLFVDVVHTALARLLLGEDALAPQVFVVNLSVGIRNMQFAGRISGLARLIDWWSAEAGVLFVISAGNIVDDVLLEGMTLTQFEKADTETKRLAAREAMRKEAYKRALLAPAEAINGLTVGAVSADLSPTTPPEVSGIERLETDEELVPALTSAQGLGLRRAIKPDVLACGGAHEMRLLSDSGNLRLKLVKQGSRTGLVVATPPIRGGTQSPSVRVRGTSAATALTTRGILQAAYELVRDDGPYAGQELSREKFALLTRALAVNSASWSAEAKSQYEDEMRLLGNPRLHQRGKEAVARRFGFGALDLERMSASPEFGATLVGLGSVRSERGRMFYLPLPESLSGEKIPRSMRVTVAWFTPVNPVRAHYRLASLEAVAVDYVDGADADRESDWGLSMKADGLGDDSVKKGSVWSRRLTWKNVSMPTFDDGARLPIRVQCRDATSDGGLDQDAEISFAIAVTLETEVEMNIFNEISQKIKLRTQVDR